MKLWKLAIIYSALFTALAVWLILTFSNGSYGVAPLQRVLDLNQTVTTSYGDTITIEKVITTRQNVRVLWRVDPVAQPQETVRVRVPASNDYACCSLKLEVGSKSATFSDSYPYFRSQSPEIDSVAEVPFLDEQGDWTLSTSYFSTWTGNAYYPDRPGPTFRFIMPPPIR